MIQFVKKHWRGENLLLTSILGGGLLAVAFALAGLRIFLIGIASFDLSLAVTSALQLCFFASCTVVLVWASVGIWRSAQNLSRTTKWSVRGGLLIAIVAALPFAVATTQTASELAHLAFGRDPLGPPAKLKATGNTIQLHGLISQGTAAEFEALIARHPNVQELELESPGGRIAEADRIANIVRDRHLVTVVKEYCLSACTDVLLAGSKRLAVEGARIGFHQVTMDGYGAADDRLATESIRDSYKRAGFDGAFIEKATSTPPTDMWIPSTTELKKAGVLTEVQSARASRED